MSTVLENNTEERFTNGRSQGSERDSRCEQATVDSAAMLVRNKLCNDIAKRKLNRSCEAN